MEKFRKGQAEFHLIRLVSQRDTNKLWIDQYPQLAMKHIRQETDFTELLNEFNDEEGFNDDYERLTDQSTDKDLIECGFLDYANDIIEFPDLFEELKDQIKVGDIVYSPFYETRMQYGINIAFLDKNGKIALVDNEGYYPPVPKWQEAIMRHNKLSFTKALLHITYEYGHWDSSDLLDMW